MFCRIKKCILPMFALIVIRVKEVLNFNIFQKYIAFIFFCCLHSVHSSAIQSFGHLCQPHLFFLSPSHVIFKIYFSCLFSFCLPTVSSVSNCPLFFIHLRSVFIIVCWIKCISVSLFSGCFPYRTCPFFQIT
jgi:hypothetical protein